MNRRAFLSTVATAGAGLVVGEAALDAWDRLTWKRRLFPGWGERGTGFRFVRAEQVYHSPSNPLSFTILQGYSRLEVTLLDGGRASFETAELTQRPDDVVLGGVDIYGKPRTIRFLRT